MPYKLQVLVERQVLFQVVTGHYSLQEMRAANKDFCDFSDGLNNTKTLVLADTTTMKTMHSNIAEVRQEMKGFFQHPNYGILVSYGGSDKAVQSFLINMGAVLFNQPIRLCATEAEAVNFIISKYPDLAHSLPEALQGYHAQDA